MTDQAPAADSGSPDIPGKPTSASRTTLSHIMTHNDTIPSGRDRDTTFLARLVNAAAERLHSGADASYGFHLERPSYLSLAVVTCSPDRSMPELACPVA
jgi:hypothetical protein